MTTTPTPRPVPTQGDRMRDARTDRTDHRNCTPGTCDLANRLGLQPTSFATYLDRHERDQLDAEAACARQERDEALDDRDAYKEARDVLRKQLDNLQPLIAAAKTWRRHYGNTSEAFGAACTALAATVDALPPGLGSPAPRAQDEPAREEIRWAYRWIGADGQVYDEMDASDNAIETAEQRAHRIAAKRLTGTVRGEVLRYRVLTMPAEVVATYPAEREG